MKNKNSPNIILKDFLDRKGFYELYKKVKDKSKIEVIKRYFETLDSALKFFEKKNNTPEDLFNVFIDKKLKNKMDGEIEMFCTDIYFLIINEYKDDWQMHKIAELFYAYKPSSNKYWKIKKNILDSFLDFEDNINKSVEKGRDEAEELLAKYPPENIQIYKIIDLLQETKLIKLDFNEILKIIVKEGKLQTKKYCLLANWKKFVILELFAENDFIQIAGYIPLTTVNKKQAKNNTSAIYSFIISNFRGDKRLTISRKSISDVVSRAKKKEVYNYEEKKDTTEYNYFYEKVKNVILQNKL